jgi:hypothetical protein
MQRKRAAAAAAGRQAGRMCYKEKRYTLDIVLDRQRQS